MTDIALIEAAAARMAGHVRRTPLLNAPLLDKAAGRRIFVKAECLQVTGSFKARGGWSAVSALSHEARKRGVIAYPSGNHAQGVAHAAARHDSPLASSSCPPTLRRGRSPTPAAMGPSQVR